MLDDAGYKDQTGHQTDDYGVPESTGHGYQRLPLGIARLCRGGYQRGRTHTGFIGKQSAGKTVAACHRHSASDKTAAHCPGRKSRGADRCDRLAKHITVDDQDNDTSDHIENSHERNQHLRNSGDGLDSADDHKAYDQAKADSYDPGRDPQILLEVRCHCIGLHHAADSEAAYGSKGSKNDAQPFHVQTTVQCVHCAADHCSVLTLYAVFHSDQRLSVLRGNSEYTGKPGPQNRSWASEGDRGTDADDISCTDRRGQGCGQCAKLGHIAFRIRIPRHRQTNCLKNVLLNKPCPDSHKNMCTEQHDDQWPSPEKSVQFTDNC